MELLSLKVPVGGGTPPVAISPPAGIPSGEKFSLGFLATRFLEVAIIVGIIISLFYLIYGGFFWLQASGDKTKWDKSRRIIVYSIIGLIIMAFSLVAVNLVSQALGVKTLIGNN